MVTLVLLVQILVHQKVHSKEVIMRKQSDVWQHWEEIELDNGSHKWRCRYCQQKPQNKNATKCSEHTLKCQERIGQGVEFTPAPTLYKQNASLSSPGAGPSNGPTSGPSGSGLKRKAEFDDEEVTSAARSLMSDRNGSDAGHSRWKDSSYKQRHQQAVEFLSELLSNDEPSARKKPISMYSEEDYKKEERELRLKELRLNVKHLQLRNQLLEKLLPMTDRASEALDKYLSEPQSERHGVYEEGNGHVIYVNADPDAIAPNVH